MNTTDKNSLLLTQLVFMFQGAALQQMGKLKDPLLDKIQQNLEQAKISIDMIDMMYTKMTGNLSKEEERMFTTVLQDLRLNYVDEVTKKQRETPEQPPSDQPSKPSTS